jgi:hypothetical protein
MQKLNDAIISLRDSPPVKPVQAKTERNRCGAAEEALRRARADVDRINRAEYCVRADGEVILKDATDRQRDAQINLDVCSEDARNKRDEFQAKLRALDEERQQEAKSAWLKLAQDVVAPTLRRIKLASSSEDPRVARAVDAVAAMLCRDEDTSRAFHKSISGDRKYSPLEASEAAQKLRWLLELRLTRDRELMANARVRESVNRSLNWHDYYESSRINLDEMSKLLGLECV